MSGGVATPQAGGAPAEPLRREDAVWQERLSRSFALPAEPNTRFLRDGTPALGSFAPALHRACTNRSCPILRTFFSKLRSLCRV